MGPFIERLHVVEDGGAGSSIVKARGLRGCECCGPFPHRSGPAASAQAASLLAFGVFHESHGELLHVVVPGQLVEVNGCPRCRLRIIVLKGDADDR